MRFWPGYKLFAATCVLLLAACQQQLPVKDLIVTTKQGERHFTVEMALSPEEQQRGLMFRDQLDNDKGMLFLFDSMRELTFWMKNTRIPLDIIFVAKDGEIVHVHANAKPYDETPLPSLHPAQAVLEIPGGQAHTQNIEAGDRLSGPAWDLMEKK